MLKRNATVILTASFLSVVIIGFWVYPYLRYWQYEHEDFAAMYRDAIRLGPRDDRWMAWKWTKSDPAYEALWNKIQELEERDLIAKFAESQENKYRANPNDYFALYGWAYSALRYQSQWARRRNYYLVTSQDVVIKRFTELPRNYEWARLRFMLTHPHYPDKNYERLARRLLQVDADDLEVYVVYINFLADLRNVEEKRRVLHYLFEIRKKWPAEYALMALEGNAYAKLWHYEKKPEYADKAITLYKFYWNNESIEEYKRRKARLNAERLEKELIEYMTAKT